MKPGLFLAGTALSLHAAVSYGGAMVFFEPGPRLANDEACVSSGTKVGDSLSNPSGDVLTIRSVSGKFASQSLGPCTSDALPILARVKFTESPAFHSSVSVTLPPDLVVEDLAERERFENIRLRAHHQSGHAFLWVKSWDRRTLSDFDAFAEQLKREQGAGSDTTQSPTEHLTIHGAPALRWDTEIKPRSLVPNTSYLTTALQGDSEIVVVTVWGVTRKLKPLRLQMTNIAENVYGITREGSEHVDAPVPQPTTH